MLKCTLFWDVLTLIAGAAQGMVTGDDCICVTRSFLCASYFMHSWQDSYSLLTNNDLCWSGYPAFLLTMFYYTQIGSEIGFLLSLFFCLLKWIYCIGTWRADGPSARQVMIYLTKMRWTHEKEINLWYKTNSVHMCSRCYILQVSGSILHLS